MILFLRKVCGTLGRNLEFVSQLQRMELENTLLALTFTVSYSFYLTYTD